MRRRRRGATLVEATIIFVLLFLSTMVIIEFGRVLNMYQTMTDAAREGARFGTAPCQSAVEGQPCSYGGYSYQSGQLPSAHSITAYAGGFLDADHIKGYRVDVDWARDDFVLNANGESIPANYRHVAVDVYARYHWLCFPFPDLPLHTRSVMKHELELE